MNWPPRVRFLDFEYLTCQNALTRGSINGEPYDIRLSSAMT
jgi:hypothetical protein